MGTTGTIMGCSTYLKERNPQVQIIGLQPLEGSSIPGIRRWSSEYLPKIFDAFFSTKTKGMGIGLSISRSIIESHQGRISARTLEQGGAEFAFELPVAVES